MTREPDAAREPAGARAVPAGGFGAPNALPLPRDGGGAVVRTLLIAQHILFVVLLGAGTIRSWQAQQLHPVLWGAIALAVLYVVGVWLGLRSTSRAAALAWLVVLSAGWVALVAVSPEFIWVAFALFFLYLYFLPRWWGYAAVALALAVSIGAQLMHSGFEFGSSGVLPQVVGPVFGAAVAVGMSAAYQRLVAENNHRLALVQELEAVNANLIATQDALARMQREAGISAERQRLARDIHDTLAQGFSSILLLARAGEGAGDSEAAAPPDGSASGVAGAPGSAVAGESAPGVVGAPDADSRTALASGENLTHIARVAQENLDAARRVVNELQPRELQETPLSGALERLVAQLREQTRIDAEFIVTGSVVTLPTMYEVTLLRIAQSALANVRLHADATTVNVMLNFAEPGRDAADLVVGGVTDGADGDAAASAVVESALVGPDPVDPDPVESDLVEVDLVEPAPRTVPGSSEVANSPSSSFYSSEMRRGEVALTVSDDGRGFDVETVGSNPGYGLRAMRERVDEFGGMLEVNSSPGAGTELVVRLPLRQPLVSGGSS